MVSSYSNFLDALLIRFPGSGKDYAVESAMFHPQFDRTAANQLLQVSLTEPMPAIPLQKHNAAVRGDAARAAAEEKEFMLAVNAMY